MSGRTLFDEYQQELNELNTDVNACETFEQYKSIQYLKEEYKRKLLKEMRRIQRLRVLQKKMQEWIQKSGLSWVELCVVEPRSSGYRYCVVDIHSSNEAYIFWTNGGYGYHYLISIFEDDFGNLYDDGSYRGGTEAIIYACEGILKDELRDEYIAKINKECRVDHLSCCHTKMKK